MLFAELTAEGWVAIIGAIFLGLGQLLQMYLQHRKAKVLSNKIDQNTAITKETQEATIVGTKKIDSTLEKAKTEAAEDAKKAATEVAVKAVLVAKEVAKDAKEGTAKTTEAVETLTTAINGRMDELIKAKAEEAYLRGKQEGITEQVAQLLIPHAQRIEDIGERLDRHVKRNEEHVQTIEAAIAELQKQGVSRPTE